MPHIIIPAALRNRMREPVSNLHLDSATVGDALRTLAERHPELADILFTQEGEPRPTLRIFVADRPIEESDGLKTAVGSDEEIVLLSPIAGG